MGIGEAVSQVTRCQQLTDPYACHRHCSTVSPLYDTASRLQGETAQNIVFQALRHAAVTETVVRHFRYTTDSWGKYKTLAKLRKSSQADCLAAFSEEFLEFHRQISQTMN
ncbi:hypothetical protein YC2023_019479 [Brassica napus]